VKTGRSTPQPSRGADAASQAPEIHLQNPMQLTDTGINRQAQFLAGDQQILWLQADNDLHQFRIIAMTSGGQQVHPLTPDGTYCQAFALFPHARRIVFSAVTDAQMKTKAPAAQDLPGTSIPNWLFDPAHDLYVLDVQAPAAGSPEWNLDAKTETRWTHHASYAGEPAVSWDGNQVLYVTYEAEGGALHLLDHNGQPRGRLLQWPGYLGGARQSPDGQTIVFHANPRDGKPGLALYLCDHDGSNVRLLTAEGNHNFFPAWHPSQEFIIYSSDGEDQDFELTTIRPDGTRRQRITFRPGLDTMPAFSRSGRQIIWTSQRLAREPWQTNIWRAIWIP
jgi:hypothetical protein